MKDGGLCGNVALRLEVGREFDLHTGSSLSLEHGQKEKKARKERGEFRTAVASCFTNHIHNTAGFPASTVLNFLKTFLRNIPLEFLYCLPDHARSSFDWLAAFDMVVLALFLYVT